MFFLFEIHPKKTKVIQKNSFTKYVMISSWAVRKKKEVNMALETDKSENSFKFSWDVRTQYIFWHQSFLLFCLKCWKSVQDYMIFVLLLPGIQSWAFLQWKISASTSLLDQRTDDNWRRWFQTRSYSQTHSVKMISLN